LLPQDYNDGSTGSTIHPWNRDKEQTMSGLFVTAKDVAREQLDWGSLAWCCRPAGTGMKNLVVIEVTLTPGGGHAFHRHPRQEEVIYCIEGRVEQWLDRRCQVLEPGDSIVIPAGVVHASFNTQSSDARLLAILGPSVNDQSGYEVDEVADEEPWKSLR
jgi:quercetin dioxygenase-like cupin family protein